jgi:ATP:ADP antiporter, AAA family
LEAENRRAVLAATAAAALLIANQVAGKSVRDALFLSSFSVASLPPVMMASSLASVMAVILLSRAMRRASPFRVEPLALGLATLLLGGWWLLSVGAPRAAALAFYLHMALFGSTLVSGFWSVVNERFDPYTAKRVVGRIGAGASLGGVAGGLLAWGASGVLSVPTMLVVMAGLNLACLFCMRHLTPAAGAAGSAGKGDDMEDAPTALRTLARVPYVRDLALLVGLSALAEALLDYFLKAQAAAAYSKGPQLMSFFALFHAATGVVGLVVQALFGRTSVRVLGLAGTVALRPAAVLLGAVLGAFDPRLRSGVLAYGSQEMLSNSLFRSGYELLYTPIPEGEKRPTKAVVDVGFDKLGALAGGATVLIVVAAAPTAALRVLAGLVALLSLGTLALTGRLHRGYVKTLEQSLRAGRVKLDSSDVQDEATLLTLAQTNLSLDRENLLREIEALRGGDPSTFPIDASDPLLRAISDLRSGRPERIREALRGGVPDPTLVPHLVPLLERNDVFLDVLRALRAAAPAVTGQLVDTLLDPAASPVVRRRVPRVLKACPSQRAADGLRLGLEDPRFDLRTQCGLALAAITRKNPALVVPREAVFAAVLKELELGAAAWASIDRGIDHAFTLLSLALPREPLQIALLALRGSDRALRGTALEYLENVLPDTLRRALWKHVGAGPASPHAPRARQEVVDDLLRSMDSVSIKRAGLRAKSDPG